MRPTCFKTPGPVGGLPASLLKTNLLIHFIHSSIFFSSLKTRNKQNNNKTEKSHRHKHIHDNSLQCNSRYICNFSIALKLLKKYTQIEKILNYQQNHITKNNTRYINYNNNCIKNNDN